MNALCLVSTNPVSATKRKINKEKGEEKKDIFKHIFLINMHTNLLVIVINFYFSRSGGGLNFCSSSKLPGDTDAADLRTAF